MVSPDSDLYRAHPDYAIHDGLHEPSLGRHQLTLDLTKQEVRAYIVNAVEAVLKSAPIDFVKWDYNRNITDIPATSSCFFHDYVLGLYQVVGQITKDFPQILFENCASGGNRCDLGMLSYFPQTWTSDDTDSFERAKIQDGMACGITPILSDSKRSSVRYFALDSRNLFIHNKPKDLANKIDYWIEHPEEKEANAKQYLAYVKQFDFDTSMDKMEAMYLQTIAAWKNNHPQGK